MESFIDRFERLARHGTIICRLFVATSTCALALYVFEGRTAMERWNTALSIAKLKRQMFEEREGKWKM